MDPNWAASDELLEFIHNTIYPTCGSILELGSGYSTQFLSECLHFVTSIEHDTQFLNKVIGVTYIHAPIKLYGKGYKPLRSISKRIQDHTGWYDPAVIQKALLGQDFHAILVDGPPRDFGRSGFLQHLDIFPVNNTPIIFDDMHRIDDLYIAERVAHKLQRTLTVYNHGPKPFGVLLP